MSTEVLKVQRLRSNFFSGQYQLRKLQFYIVMVVLGNLNGIQFFDCKQDTFFNGIYLSEIGRVLSPEGEESPVENSLSQKAIFLAAHGEDLTWVHKAEEKFQVQFIVYQSRDRAAPNFVPNVGSEACKYAKIFTDYYDKFPHNALFLHAHEIGNHNGPHRNLSQSHLIEAWLRDGRNERWKSGPSPRTYHVRMRPLIKHMILLEIIGQSPKTFGEDSIVSRVVKTSLDAKTAKVVWKEKYLHAWPYRTLQAEYYTARNAQFATTSSAVTNHPRRVWDFAYKVCISRLSEDGTDPAKKKKEMNKRKNKILRKRPGLRIGAQFETFWKHLLAPDCDAMEPYTCP